MRRRTSVPLVALLLPWHAIALAFLEPTSSVSVSARTQNPPLPMPNVLIPPQQNYGLFDRPLPEVSGDDEGQQAIGGRAIDPAITSMSSAFTSNHFDSAQLASLSSVAVSVFSDVDSHISALTSAAACATALDCTVTGLPTGTNRFMDSAAALEAQGLMNWLCMGLLYLLPF